jgi:hypothetical protein
LFVLQQITVMLQAVDNEWLLGGLPPVLVEALVDGLGRRYDRRQTGTGEFFPDLFYMWELQADDRIPRISTSNGGEGGISWFPVSQGMLSAFLFLLT